LLDLSTEEITSVRARTENPNVAHSNLLKGVVNSDLPVPKSTMMTSPTTFMFPALVCFLLSSSAVVNAFDYNITGIGGILLTDNRTGITDLKTIFRGDPTKVEVVDIQWGYTGYDTNDTTIYYTTIVDGEPQAEGTISLVGVDRELPTSFEVGYIQIDKSTS
jgi:hypothetical protein